MIAKRFTDGSGDSTTHPQFSNWWDVVDGSCDDVELRLVGKISIDWEMHVLCNEVHMANGT